MAKVIELQFPARCLDCGAELEAGDLARYYGRGRIYGLDCHGRPEDGPTVKEQAGAELAEISEATPTAEDQGFTVEGHYGAVVEPETKSAEPYRIHPHELKDCDSLHGPMPDGAACPDAPPHREVKPKRAARKRAPKVETPAAALLRAVKVAAKGIDRRPGIPALTGIMVEAAERDVLLFTSTDLEMTVRVKVTAGQTFGAPPWRALVPGRLMIDALAGLKSAERIEFGPSEGSTFTIGGATIRTLVAEDFPNVTEVSHRWGTWPAAELAEAIRTVFPHVSRDEARPILTGILVESGGRLAATDSYTLAAVDVPGAKPSGLGAEAVLLPARALKVAAGILGKRAEGTVEIRTRTADDASVVGLFLPDGTMVEVRAIEGSFPNYGQLIPDGAENRLETGSELVAAVERAAPLARESSPVRLELKPGMGARVTASSPDLGTVTEAVPAEYQGEELCIAFNPAYLLRTLAVAPGAELEIRDGLKPAVVRADGRIGLVMPVRLPVK